MPLSRSQLGTLFVLVSAIGFGTSGTIQALAPAQATPYVIVGVRTLVGSVCLFLWCLYKNKLPQSIKAIPFGWVFLSAFFLMVATLSFFLGVSQIGVAAGSLISTGMTPVWTAIIALIVYKKIPKAEWYFATILAVVGVVMINGIGEIPREKILYFHFLLINGLAYACYICVTPKLIKNLDPEVATMLVIAVVAICFLPVYFLFPSGWILGSVRGISVALALGIFTAGIAYTFLATGLKYTTPAMAATVGLAEPVVAALLGIFLLQEYASPRSLCGIALVFFALVILVFADNRRMRINKAT